MLRIRQCELSVDHTQEDLQNKICRMLRIKREALIGYHVRKRSVDARKKPELFFHYCIDCEVSGEEQVFRKADKRKVERAVEKPYRFPKSGSLPMEHRPVIVGTGPAGLFCGLMLAEHGYRPVLLERGQDVDTRLKDVEDFWNTGKLNPKSNVQFGEGGAGTFSDGKLNTLVKDKEGRNRKVLEIFAEAGADSSVLYENKPHVGTDRLIHVVKNIRKKICAHGGEVRFGEKVTGIRTENGKIKGVVLESGETLGCETVVFAVGHSARDTFQMLFDAGLAMEAKEFAAGFRVEHLQSKINLSQYGREDIAPLSAAPYKIAAKASDGRGVYSFCMCPGGYVVNASSEEKRLAINGMSYSGRSGKNANSAIIISVKKEDFQSSHPLAGIQFQRSLEERAYKAGNGRIPVMRFEDFKKRVSEPDSISTDFWKDSHPDSPLQPAVKGLYRFSDITDILPKNMTYGFLEGMEKFSCMIEGFAEDDVLVCAVESRTSSPVRILRNFQMESNIKGIYPCGEGAGYAGGITSAAMDGMRVAETIAAKYRSF